jgi:tripartite-type tricarboxylate transporter receptor subunit TctC
VYVAPGGSTDLSNRALAAAIEREMGARFSVLNMPGAQGGVAAAYVWNAPRDGHTWYGTGEASLGLGVLGAHTTTSKDWSYLIVGGAPGVLSVPANSPFQSAEELIAAVRARPDEIRIASSIQASAWHVQYLALSEAGDLQFRWVSYPGSHPSQVAALSGEIEVVLTSLGEQAEFLRGGQLRPLAVIQSDPIEMEGVGSIPPITDVVPEIASYLPLQQFVGSALPADTPPETLARVQAAFQSAMQSEEVQNFGRQSHSVLMGLSGDEAQRFTERQERVFSWLLYDAGLATHSPEQFGIERP